VRNIIGISDLIDPPDVTIGDASAPRPRAARVARRRRRSLEAAPSAGPAGPVALPILSDLLRRWNWRAIEPLTRRDPSEQDLLWLEEELGGPLPDAYRGFLCTHGWTRFGDAMTFPLGEAAPLGASAKIAAFLGFSSEIRRDLGFLITEVYADTLPPGTIPIASDAAGNLVLLGVGAGPAVRDRVWLWDRECRGIDDQIDDMVDDLEAAGVDTADDDEGQILRRWETAFSDRRTRPPGFANVYAVADSFVSFVASLDLAEDRPLATRRRAGGGR
jgi:SMI1 / KNR4 family (SUKH-1)